MPYNFFTTLFLMALPVLTTATLFFTDGACDDPSCPTIYSSCLQCNRDAQFCQNLVCQTYGHKARRAPSLRHKGEE
jgi:hypothetical protein